MDVLTNTNQYLTFTLDEELFAVEIMNIREVIDYTRVTRVPGMPPFVKGVINLRGSVVPVVDLRLKFRMSEVEKTDDTCIIILEIDLDGETTLLGAVADSVHEVFELTPEQIEPPPKIGTRLNTNFIKGMGKCDNDNKFIIILNIQKVFSSEELNLVMEMQEERPAHASHSE